MWIFDFLTYVRISGVPDLEVVIFFGEGLAKKHSWEGFVLCVPVAAAARGTGGLLAEVRYILRGDGDSRGSP